MPPRTNEGHFLCYIDAGSRPNFGKEIRMLPRLRYYAAYFTIIFYVSFTSPEVLSQTYTASDEIIPTPVTMTVPPELTEFLLSQVPKGNPPQGAVDFPTAATVIKSENFEGTFPNDWTLFDNNGATGGEVLWAKDNTRASGGTFSGWSAGGGANGVAGGANYPNNMASWMVYGPFDLSDATTAVADFQLWLDSQLNVDYFKWLSSTDGASFGGFQTSGNTGGWAPVQFDFSATGATGNATVWLAFIFESDGATNAAGAYIDDIVISKDDGTPEFDLVLNTIDVADEPYGQGSPLSIMTGVENTGPSVSTSWTIRYYLSTDATITAGDTSLGSVSGLPAINAGESMLFPVGASLPSPLANGDYYIGAIIETVDSNAANNVNVDATAITVDSNTDIRIRPTAITIDGAPGPLSPLGSEGSEKMDPDTYIRTPGRSKSAVLNELLPRARKEGQIDIIVGLDTAFVPEGKLSAAARSSQQAAIQSVQTQALDSLRALNVTEKARFQTIPFMALRVDAQALEALASDPRVTSIEEDRIAKPLMDSSNPVIGSPIAWAGNMDGTGQAVAVLDTGVDTSHPWFTTGGSRIVAEACYSTDNGGVTDSLCPGGVTASTAPGSGVNCVGIGGCDHGTHVAGTVGGNNGAGPGYGVARDADIIAMQVFSKFLTAGSCGTEGAPCVRTYSSDQIRALERILVLNATLDIASVNMSLGGGQYFDQASCDAANVAVKLAIDNLASVGIATVIASGNDGFTTSTGTPGCISTAITVGATNDRDSVAGFSNIANFIDLLAPGVAITSSVPGGGTGSKQGTSMATPHVAGAWSMLKEFAPAATVAQVLAALNTTGTVIDDARVGGSITGMRRINVEQALANLGHQIQSFGISNEGFSTLNVTSIAPTVATPWLSFNPPGPFSVAPGRMQVVNVVVDFDTAPVGVSNRQITIASNDPNENPYPGAISLTVNNAGLDPAPTATVITPATVGPTNADSVSFALTFSEAVVNFNDASDVTITHSGTSNTGVSISGSGSSYTATVTGISGTGSFTLKANTASDVEDADGQGLASSVTSASVFIDNTPPSVTIGAPSSASTSTGPVSYTVTYAGADAVSLAAGNITLNTTDTANGSIAVSGEGTTSRTVTISSITGTGTLGISIAAGTATDTAGNGALSAGPSATFAVDNTAPSATVITPSETGPTNATSVSFAITFSETVVNFNDASDVVITHSGTAHTGVAIGGAGASWTANVTGISGDGSFTLKVNTGSDIEDGLGNSLDSSVTSAAVTIDNAAPTVSISAPTPDNTTAGPVTYTITYTDADSVTLANEDVTLTKTGDADGTVAVTGSGTESRTVTISAITGSGTLGISIAAETASDTAGNLAPAAGPSDTVNVAIINLIFEDGFEL